MAEEQMEVTSGTEKRRTVVVAMDGSDFAKFAFHWYVCNIYRTGDWVVLVYATELPGGIKKGKTRSGENVELGDNTDHRTIDCDDRWWRLDALDRVRQVDDERLDKALDEVASLSSSQETTRQKISNKIEDFKKLFEEEKVCSCEEIQGEVKLVNCRKPEEGLVKTVQELKARLVVTGTRGLGTIRKTILGSVSDYLLHNAGVPVAICRQ